MSVMKCESKTTMDWVKNENSTVLSLLDAINYKEPSGSKIAVSASIKILNGSLDIPMSWLVAIAKETTV